MMQNMGVEHTDELNTSSITAKEKGTIKDTKKTSEKATINKAYKQKDMSQNIERRNQEVYNIVTSLQKDRLERSHNKPDKFDIIGELVAQKLRSLPTPYAQCTVEHLIHNLLYDAEMGQYNEPRKPPVTQVQSQMEEFLRFPTGSSGSSYSNPLSVNTNLHSTQPNSKTQHFYANPSSTDTQHSYPNPSSTDTQHSYSNPPSVETQYLYSNPPRADPQNAYSNPTNTNTQPLFSHPSLYLSDQENEGN